MTQGVCDGTRPDGTPCAEPLPPTHQRRSSKCAACREEHRKAKQADYQWAWRVSVRELRIARQHAQGNTAFWLPEIPPRRLTPSWTQDGRPALRPELDALTALAEQLADLQQAVAAASDALQEALRARAFRDP